MSRKVTGTFTGTGQSDALNCGRTSFSVSISGTFAATVKLQRSFDAGLNWLDVDQWSAPDEAVGQEGALDVLYRLNCTAFTSGTVSYVLAV